MEYDDRHVLKMAVVRYGGELMTILPIWLAGWGDLRMKCAYGYKVCVRYLPTSYLSNETPPVNSARQSKEVQIKLGSSYNDPPVYMFSLQFRHGCLIFSTSERVETQKSLYPRH